MATSDEQKARQLLTAVERLLSSTATLIAPARRAALKKKVVRRKPKPVVAT